MHELFFRCHSEERSDEESTISPPPGERYREDGAGDQSATLHGVSAWGEKAVFTTVGRDPSLKPFFIQQSNGMMFYVYAHDMDEIDTGLVVVIERMGLPPGRYNRLTTFRKVIAYGNLETLSEEEREAWDVRTPAEVKESLRAFMDGGEAAQE